MKTKVRIFRGVLIENNMGGFRWFAFRPGHGFFRSDTLAGVKRLISASFD